MAHAQKPDFVFRRNGRIHLNRRRGEGGRSVQSTTGSRGVRISGSNAGYTMFRGSVKSTGYPIHSPFSPSIPLSCVTVCHHISTELYLLLTTNRGHVPISPYLGGLVFISKPEDRLSWFSGFVVFLSPTFCQILSRIRSWLSQCTFFSVPYLVFNYPSKT
jgi:hypothetical protein